MKKYIKPVTEVIELDTENNYLLGTSVADAPTVSDDFLDGDFE